MTEAHRRSIARAIHEAKIAFCWGKAAVGQREPWPDKLPGDFGYVPQPWVDVAFTQADAVLKATHDQTIAE